MNVIPSDTSESKNFDLFSNDESLFMAFITIVKEFIKSISKISENGFDSDDLEVDVEEASKNNASKIRIVTFWKHILKIQLNGLSVAFGKIYNN